MGFFRKLIGRKASSGAHLSTRSSQHPTAPKTDQVDPVRHQGSHDPVSDGKRQLVPTGSQAEQTATERRGHVYDSVKLDGETRGHLGDIFGNVTYNIGTPQLVERNGEQHEREEKGNPFGKSKALMRLLSALEFSVMESRLASINPAHTKTCNWVVDTSKFKRWRGATHQIENHGVLWIKGNPGAGKSTLMKFILGVEEKRTCGDVVISYFFNARGHALERSTEGLYRSLLHQLLSKLPRLYSSRHHISQDSWPIQTLENMLRASLLSLNADEHIVCYIDALDECTQDEIRDAVKFFEEVSDLAVSQGLHVLICLSSRHYPLITMQRHEELRLDDQGEHLGDIASYVESNLERLTIPRHVKNEIQENIQRRCSGIFLWVVLVIKILKENHDGGASFSELIASLKAVPEKLQDIFAGILHKSNEQTIAALKWVSYARRPLRTVELYFAIRTSASELSSGEWNQEDLDLPSMERFVLRSARGLVELVKNSPPHHTQTQFIHESVREHLLNGGLASLTADDRVNFEACTHAELAEWCLSYFQLDLSTYFDLIKQSPEGGLQFPLLGYALNHVLSHMELAYAHDALQIEELDRVPVKLLISTFELRLISYDVPNNWFCETTTLLYLLLIGMHHSLAKGLLEYRTRIEKFESLASQSLKESNIMFDVNAQCGLLDNSVLGFAATKEDSTMVRLILDLGAEVNSGGGRYGSPLGAAVACERLDNVQLLLQRGADIGAETYGGVNPLREAIKADSVRLVSLLLKRGADANSVGGEDGSALGTSIYRKNRHKQVGAQNDIVELLLAHGARPNLWQSESPLWIATIYRDTAMMQRLLGHGADVNSRDDKRSMTPLYMVASAMTRDGAETSSESQVLAIKILLGGGADTNATCEPYGTPLIVAIAKYQLEAALTLLEHGADFRHRSDYGTALDVALNGGLTQMSRQLWDASFPVSYLTKRVLECSSNAAQLWDDTRSENNGYPRKRPVGIKKPPPRSLKFRDSLNGLYSWYSSDGNNVPMTHHFRAVDQLIEPNDSISDWSDSSREEDIIGHLAASSTAHVKTQSQACTTTKPARENAKRPRATSL